MRMFISVSCALALTQATLAPMPMPLMTRFYVCSSNVQGMDGLYVLDDEMHADSDTPVFVREDDDTDQDNNGALSSEFASDFRLFRHNGFWMFADMAEWPPTTHFRCDPTRRDLPDVDTLSSCSVNLPRPPRRGYTPADRSLPAMHLVLQDYACDENPLGVERHNGEL